MKIRLLAPIASLFCVATITFFLMHAIPGDPFIGERALPEEVLAALRSHYGLDRPLLFQYLQFLKSLLTLDLGASITYPNRSVITFILEGLPISAFLGLQALLVALPLGILLGSLNRGCTLFISLPNFVVASLIQYFFAIKFHLLPIARWGSWEHTILPSLALAVFPTAMIARLTRANLAEVMKQDYIRTAFAKGLTQTQVLFRHALPNSLFPVITYLGPLLSSILTGSFVVEKIYAIPGLGGWMIHSIQGRDYPMIVGLTLFFSSVLILSVVFSDFLHRWIDPRLKRRG